MTWVKLDVEFFGHPKVLAAGRDAAMLYLAGLCYSSRQLSDGRIPKAGLRVIAAEAGVKPAVHRRLIEVGLWHDSGDNFEIHNYLTRQRSADNVAEISAARAEAGRRGAAARYGKGDGKPKGKPPSKLPSKPYGKSMADTEVDTDTENHSSSHGSGARPQPAEDDPVLDELAERRAELEHPEGKGIGSRPPYLAKVRASYASVVPRLAELREQHPDWTDEDLADELDPDTAPRRGNALTVEETDAHIAELHAARNAATPMPAGIRRAARR